ncbi:MAG TPA: hypothetical protein PLO56_05550 [Rhodothermales bacterium]|nr:hypothetical protein [Rhodothermales bacterium]
MDTEALPSLGKLEDQAAIPQIRAALSHAHPVTCHCPPKFNKGEKSDFSTIRAKPTAFGLGIPQKKRGLCRFCASRPTEAFSILLKKWYARASCS